MELDANASVLQVLGTSLAPLSKHVVTKKRMVLLPIYVTVMSNHPG